MKVQNPEYSTNERILPSEVNQEYKKIGMEIHQLVKRKKQKQISVKNSQKDQRWISLGIKASMAFITFERSGMAYEKEIAESSREDLIPYEQLR